MILTGIVFCNICSSAVQYETLDTFFIDLKNRIIEEYRFCTEDTLTTGLDSILRWKQSINLLTEMKDYADIRREFVYHTGITTEALPCEMLRWHLDRLRYLRGKEDSVRCALLDQSDAQVDSIRLYKELHDNLASSFDFPGIPFGITKKVFEYLFNKQFSYPLNNKGAFMMIEHLPIQGVPFIVKFYFTNKSVFNKYEIESYSFPGDQLNSTLRNQASLLKTIVEQNIGPPDRLYRVGYFDIKSDVLTPYVAWNKNTHHVVIGFSIEKNRFLVRQIVTVVEGNEPEIK